MTRSVAGQAYGLGQITAKDCTVRAIIPASKPLSSGIIRAAMALYRSEIVGQSIEQVLRTVRGGHDEVLPLIHRAAVSPASTGASGWAAELVQTAFGDYLGSLPTSAAARMIALGMRIPMPGPYSEFKAPTRNDAPATLPWVGENLPIPVRSFDFLNLTMQPRKMGAISVISRELGKYGGGGDAVRQVLEEDGAVSLDAAYFSNAAGTDIVHPGLLNGLTPIAGFDGNDALAFETDVSNILAVIGPRNSGSIAFVTGMAAAERIALKFPLFRSPVFGSQAVSDSTLIGVDAGNLVHAFGEFDVATSTNATVHMDTEPTQLSIPGSPNTAAAPTRSLFQTDAIAIRILGDAAFGARKSNAVAYVTNVSW